MTDVYGIQAVRAVLEQTPNRARALYIQRARRDARINELIGLARSHGVRFQAMDAPWFKRRIGEGAHQGAVLECHELELANEDDLFAQLPRFGSRPLLLVLDGVTDPRNFGACLRTANAAGVHAVITPKRKSAPLSPVALKTAQGGAENLLIVEVTNLARTLTRLQEANIWIIGTDGEADRTYFDIDAGAGIAVVMGGEGKGLRRLTKVHCDQLIAIPMAGVVESLNVSVATGIVLFEILRQRRAGQPRS
jgi:23S rRNA (guanosine2251-2'-O)-methyltransferase